MQSSQSYLINIFYTFKFQIFVLLLVELKGHSVRRGHMKNNHLFNTEPFVRLNKHGALSL